MNELVHTGHLQKRVLTLFVLDGSIPIEAQDIFKHDNPFVRAGSHAEARSEVSCGCIWKGLRNLTRDLTQRRHRQCRSSCAAQELCRLRQRKSLRFGVLR